MSNQDELETEIKHLIVEALALEDVTAEEIESSAPLFGEGLGLDSIDALELSMVLSERYGVDLPEDNEETRAAFASVESLAAHIKAHSGKA